MKHIAWAVLALVLVATAVGGCKTILAGLDQANTTVQETAEPLVESANPYVALIGLGATALTTFVATVIAKAKKRNHIKDITASEEEKALFKSLAETLVHAIDVSGAGKVKDAVKSATKHNTSVAEALKALLAKEKG